MQSEKNNPKISIIVPVYNAEKTLGRCLDALIAQTYKNIEVICVNDGSKDTSLEILNSYAQKDDRIKVFTKENQGPAPTRAFALSKTTGEYLMFCDNDDFYEPNMCEMMINTLFEQNVDLVMCDANIIDLADGKLQSEATKNYHRLKFVGFKKIENKDFFSYNVLLWNKIFKTQIAKEVGYPDKYELDDAIFFYKYLSNIQTYYGLDLKLYNYYVGNPHSVMGRFYAKADKKIKYDFIFAYKNLYDYLLAMNKNRGYLGLCVLHNYFNIIKTLLPRIPNNKKREFMSILHKFADENPIVKIRPEYVELLNINSVRELNYYIKARTIDKTTFLQKIFSVKNEGNRKVLRLLGVKFKFKRKNK